MRIPFLWCNLDHPSTLLFVRERTTAGEGRYGKAMRFVLMVDSKEFQTLVLQEIADGKRVDIFQQHLFGLRRQPFDKRTLVFTRPRIWILLEGNGHFFGT